MTDIGSLLEKDLQWRETELTTLKLLALEAGHATARQRALLRSCWLLLYAHYEGFCKYAWDVYLDYIEGQHIPARDCVDDLIALSYERVLKGKLNTPTRELLALFRDELPVYLSQPIRFPVRPDAKSNLWPDVFTGNAKKLGLSCTYIDFSEIEVKALVGRRNAIAHGEGVYVNSVQDYSLYEEKILLVMHDLAVQVCDCIEGKKYRAPPAP
ncbi:MAE_28990/MAE_18760 family HEPN-like nuclease [Rhodopila globiformis]|uniref:MAE-28990/MAE-18760-like HEPN domain-containing protein n=1 Tax=Rhodopila globiformis TaxID=1071 RepID=A0A2S6N651_RHOGL|nr:MAE_28990/MAE_18760 family HEPN-like nuclease [Rhodopila globiformis]PPQ30067.1 hypothetical protein CCS01_20125 [Rhodopila globiformis]